MIYPPNGKEGLCRGDKVASFESGTQARMSGVLQMPSDIFYMKEARGELHTQKGECNVITEAEIVVMWAQDKECQQPSKMEAP